jgi:YidC/Oxa1 family membrane protein insertase
VWETDSEKLTVDTPLTLRWQSPQGIVFTQTVEIAAPYLLTVHATVHNTSDSPLKLSLTGRMRRQVPTDLESNMLVFEGPLGYFDGSLKEVAYSELEKKRVISESTPAGWLGITDKYWLVAFAPDESFSGSFAWDKNVREEAKVSFESPAEEVVPGETKTFSLKLFAGAKILTLLDRYEKDYNIPHLDLAVDFGWFYFLTKPVFYVLLYLKKFSGSFWAAILLFTVLLKLLFFPLANRSYRSMATMRKLQPLLEELKNVIKTNRRS